VWQTAKKASLLGLLAKWEESWKFFEDIHRFKKEERKSKKEVWRRRKRLVRRRIGFGVLYAVGRVLASGRVVLGLFLMAAIPFAARALVGTLPAVVISGSVPVTLKEMIEDFVRQVPQASDMIVNVMQTGAVSFVMHCKTQFNVEALLHSGLTFRGHVIRLVAAPNTQWIKLTRVVYGTTENAIKSRLLEYGTVLKMKQETIHGIGISVYSVKMEIKKPIPSRITIAHYPANVFYRGQVQQCFRCEQTGHVSKSCPFKKTAVPPAPRIIGPVTEVVSTVSDVAPVTVSSSPPEPAASSTSLVVDSTPVPVPTLPPTSMVTDPPLVPQATLSDSSSTDSSSTPRTEAGKRQRKPDGVDSAPSKRDKGRPATYAEVEREGVRKFVLEKSITPAEQQSFDRLIESALDRKQIHRTLHYRHPLMIKDDVDRTPIFKLLQEFKVPDGLADFSELQVPILPSDVPVTDLSYPRYEMYRTYIETHNRFPDRLPALPEAYQKAIDDMPAETRDAYVVYYAFTHPESLSGISPAVKDAIWIAIRDRTFIDYENS
jgi:hypothetical protein